MEFINYENRAKRSFRDNVTQQDIARLQEPLSSIEIGNYEHEMDNSFVDAYFGNMIGNLHQNGYSFVGIGKAPWHHHGLTMAVVFEDNQTFDKYWCHVSDIMTTYWMAECPL